MQTKSTKYKWQPHTHKYTDSRPGPLSSSYAGSDQQMISKNQHETSKIFFNMGRSGTQMTLIIIGVGGPITQLRDLCQRCPFLCWKPHRGIYPPATLPMNSFSSSSWCYATVFCFAPFSVNGSRLWLLEDSGDFLSYFISPAPLHTGRHTTSQQGNFTTPS